MPRWEPNARDRLIRAAIELYSARGYEHTTVRDIADRAGVTTRTYNRYFPDKREVLFDSSNALREQIVRSLRDEAPSRDPLVAVLEAISNCENLFRLREHEYLTLRESVIGQSQELQERESRKLATIAAQVTEALIDRGCPSDQAPLVADLSVVIFKRASRMWMDDPTASYRVCVGTAAEQTLRVLEPAKDFSSAHAAPSNQ